MNSVCGFVTLHPTAHWIPLFLRFFLWEGCVSILQRGTKLDTIEKGGCSSACEAAVSCKGWSCTTLGGFFGELDCLLAVSYKTSALAITDCGVYTLQKKVGDPMHGLRRWFVCHTHGAGPVQDLWRLCKQHSQLGVELRKAALVRLKAWEIDLDDEDEMGGLRVETGNEAPTRRNQPGIYRPRNGNKAFLGYFLVSNSSFSLCLRCYLARARPSLPSPPPPPPLCLCSLLPIPPPTAASRRPSAAFTLLASYGGGDDDLVNPAAPLESARGRGGKSGGHGAWGPPSSDTNRPSVTENRDTFTHGPPTPPSVTRHSSDSVAPTMSEPLEADPAFPTAATPQFFDLADSDTPTMSGSEEGEHPRPGHRATTNPVASTADLLITLTNDLAAIPEGSVEEDTEDRGSEHKSVQQTPPRRRSLEVKGATPGTGAPPQATARPSPPEQGDVPPAADQRLAALETKLETILQLLQGTQGPRE